MRSILVIAHNEWQHVWRDRVAVLFLLVMPLVFTVGISALTGGSTGAPLSVGLAGALDGTQAMAVRQWAVNHPQLKLQLLPEDAGTSLIRRGRLDALLVIGSAKSDGSPDLGIMADRSTERGARAWNVLSSLLAEVDGEQLVAGLIKSLRPDLASAATAAYREELKRSALKLEENADNVPTGAQHASPAMAVMYLLMFAAIAGEGIVYERLGGTMVRMRVAPLSPAQYLIGRLVGKVFVAVFQFAVLVLFGRYVLRVDWGNSMVSLAVLALMFSLTCGTFGLFLGSLCRTPEQNTAIATTASLALAALGGCWWPLEVVPQWLRSFGLTLPTGLAMHGFELLTASKLSWTQLGWLSSALGLYSLVFFLSAAWGLSRDTSTHRPRRKAGSLPTSHANVGPS